MCYLSKSRYREVLPEERLGRQDALLSQYCLSTHLSTNPKYKFDSIRQLNASTVIVNENNLYRVLTNLNKLYRMF